MVFYSTRSVGQRFVSTPILGLARLFNNLSLRLFLVERLNKAMNDKLALLREYLSVLFPDHPIDYQWDSSRASHHFSVDTPDGHVKHNVLLSRELVDGNPADLIHDHFREHDFRGHLEEAGRKKVLVTSEGISVLEDS